MALPLQQGLITSEVAFLCEMELVSIVPRQRLDSIDLLSGPTPVLRPPHRTDLPLWLAILLKKQRRANVVPPPWLHPDSLRDIIHYETNIDPQGWSPPPPPPVRADGSGVARRINGPSIDGSILSPPFLPSCTSTAPSSALPYHWFEVGEILLAHASDDVYAAPEVRSLLRDLQEVRAAKLRASTRTIEAGEVGVVSLRGIGAMELAETRSFVAGVVDGVRRLGASAEAARREKEEAGGGQDGDEESDDDDMGL